MLATNDLIFSKVFIREEYAQDDLPERGLKAGERLHLSLTWREVVKREDGQYEVKAFTQKIDQKAEDVSETALRGQQTTFATQDTAEKALKLFNSAFTSHGYDIFSAEPQKETILSEEYISKHRISLVPA